MNPNNIKFILTIMVRNLHEITSITSLPLCLPSALWQQLRSTWMCKCRLKQEAGCDRSLLCVYCDRSLLYACSHALNTNMNSAPVAKLIPCAFLSITIIMGFGACSTQSDLPQSQVLKISVSPTKSNHSEIKRAYLPLINYLEQEANIKIVWVEVDDYQQQLDKFHRKELDLALFGGFAFVKAFERDNADPLVMRNIDFHFTSYFLVANDNKVSDISELQGYTFSFGSKLSTSGHIMPRFFLSTQDIIPENFFSQVLYSGAHDLTALWVQEGKVDVGVADSVVVDQLFKNKKLSKNMVRILWKTPSYPNYVWAARRSLSKTVKSNIIEAFIKLSSNNDQHRKLLEQVGANYYVPAKSEDFEPIRKIAVQLGMLDE